MIGTLHTANPGLLNHADSVSFLLSEAKRSLQCEICGATKKHMMKRKLSQCGRCRMADYCCRRHQKIDWPFHRLFCGRDHQEVLEKFSDIQREADSPSSENIFNMIAERIDQWFNPSSNEKKIERDLNNLPLLFASVLLQDVDGVKLALKDPSNHVQKFKKRNVLHLAVKSSNVEIVKLLLEQPWVDPCGVQANRFATKFTQDPKILALLHSAAEERSLQFHAELKAYIPVQSLQSLVLSYLFAFNDNWKSLSRLFTPIIWKHGVPPIRQSGCPAIDSLQFPFYYHKNGLWTKVQCCMMTTQVDQNMQPVNGTLIVREVSENGEWGKIIRLRIPFLYGQELTE